jgi:uncharacterized membrane protein HdeD (DUF308 family)
MIFVQLLAGLVVFCFATILTRIYHNAGFIFWTLGIAFIASALAHLILGIRTHGGAPWSPMRELGAIAVPIASPKLTSLCENRGADRSC